MRAHYVWSPASQAKRRRRRHLERIQIFRVSEMMRGLIERPLGQAYSDSVIYGLGAVDPMKIVKVCAVGYRTVFGRGR